jgi:tetratricopeptide (TPR) repeat protein
MFRASLVIVFSIICVQQTFGQRDPKDSLISLINSTSDIPRIDALNVLAYEYYNFDDSLGLYYANTALREATKLKYEKGIKLGYMLIGLGFVSRGEYDEAFINYFRSLRLVVTGGEQITIDTYNYLGNTHRDLSNYDSAIFYYNLALKANEKIGNKNSLAKTYRNLGATKILTLSNDEAINYLLKAENLVWQSKQDDYLLAEIYGHLGKAYENKLDFVKAKNYYLKMCGIAGALKDNFLLIKCELDKAKLAYRVGDLTTSLQYCLEARRITEVYAYPPQVAEIFSKIGDIYIELAQHDLATKYFFQALKITEKLKLKRQSADIYSALAWISKEEGNFPLALNYIDQSQNIRTSINDKFGISNCYRVRGLIYRQQKNYDKAIEELEKSMRIRESINHMSGLATTILNIANVYEDQNKFDLALSLQKQAVALEEKMGKKQSLTVAYNSISSSLIKLRRLDEAESYLNKASDLIDKTKSRIDQRNNYGLYASLYKASGNFRKAYEYQARYQQLMIVFILKVVRCELPRCKHCIK